MAETSEEIRRVSKTPFSPNFVKMMGMYASKDRDLRIASSRVLPKPGGRPKDSVLTYSETSMWCDKHISIEHERGKSAFLHEQDYRTNLSRIPETCQIEARSYSLPIDAGAFHDV